VVQLVQLEPLDLKVFEVQMARLALKVLQEL